MKNLSLSIDYVVGNKYSLKDMRNALSEPITIDKQRYSMSLYGKGYYASNGLINKHLKFVSCKDINLKNENRSNINCVEKTSIKLRKFENDTVCNITFRYTRSGTDNNKFRRKLSGINSICMSSNKFINDFHSEYNKFHVNVHSNNKRKNSDNNELNSKASDSISSSSNIFINNFDLKYNKSFEIELKNNLNLTAKEVNFKNSDSLLNKKSSLIITNLFQKNEFTKRLSSVILNYKMSNNDKMATYVLILVVFIILLCESPELFIKLIAFVERHLVVTRGFNYGLVNSTKNDNPNNSFLGPSESILNYKHQLASEVLMIIKSSANFLVYLIFGRQFRLILKKSIICRLPARFFLYSSSISCGPNVVLKLRSKNKQKLKCTWFHKYCNVMPRIFVRKDNCFNSMNKSKNENKSNLSNFDNSKLYEMNFQNSLENEMKKEKNNNKIQNSLIFHYNCIHTLNKKVKQHV